MPSFEGLHQVAVAVMTATVCVGLLGQGGAAAASCEQAKLLAQDGATGDYFGRHVAIEGDHLLIGAFGDDDGGLESGSAYVFRREAGAWVQEAKLVPSDPHAQARFGYAVSISGDYALVGAVTGRNGGINSGSAYIFRRDDGGTPLDPSDDTWLEQAKLAPPDPGPADLFGVYVSLEGDYAVVGADSDDTPIENAGSVFVFVREDNDTPANPHDDTWPQRAKLTASDATIGDLFGRSVSISGDHIAVGVYADDTLGTVAGSAYVYRRQDGGTPGDPTDDTWVEQAKLYGSDTAPADQFGIGVALSGDFLVVGALHNDAAGPDSGAAYVFRRDDNGTPQEPADDAWIEQAKLVPADAAASDAFGRFVAISGDGILVGAHSDGDNGAGSGAAYFFRRDDNGTPADLSDDTWPQMLKLTAGDGAAGDLYGYSVAIRGGDALVGALSNDDQGEDSGSAYVYALLDGFDCNSNGLNDACETDCNTNGVLDACDLAAATSEDCNTNGIPDECETAGVGIVVLGIDCNANDLIDACEIALGTAADCNGNGVPDECETIARGIDMDGDIDLRDFARLQACFTGEGPTTVPAPCCIFDFDSDEDVDLADFELLVVALGGPQS